MAIYRTGLSLLSAAALSACAGLEGPASPPLGHSEVSPVYTEHSFGLKCLGQLIEETNAPPLIVHVERIRDRTIPTRLNDESRLSQAGEWLFHTAISKMETPRVRSSLSGSNSKKRREGRLVISGAWTQDDELLRRQDGDLDGEIGRFRFGVDRKARFDYIAGDFTSSTGENEVVTFATAIGVMLASGDVGARLLVEFSGDLIDLEFENRWADGPQMAQRRIAEAATLVHVARHFNVDYKPCLETGWSSASTYRASLSDYEALSRQEQNLRIQKYLSSLGYNAGAADGVWGAKSAHALMQYQADKSLPVTGRHSPVVFALIVSDTQSAPATVPEAIIASAE